jgi:hypothetical protein
MGEAAKMSNEIQGPLDGLQLTIDADKLQTGQLLFIKAREQREVDLDKLATWDDYKRVMQATGTKLFVFATKEQLGQIADLLKPEGGASE